LVDDDATFRSEVVVEDGEVRVVLRGEIDVTAVPDFSLEFKRPTVSIRGKSSS